MSRSGTSVHPPALTVLPVRGLPEVGEGDDLAGLVAASAELADEDVVVVAQKVVSKAEGAVARLQPGESADEARARLIPDEAVRVVATAPHTAIVETRHGFVCANAGVDVSNVPTGTVTLLPRDPDASARRLRAGLRQAAGVDVGVVVADSFGRPWRLGQTDVAIGCAGLAPLRDERAGVDRDGRALAVTEAAVADELAGAADLVRGKADGVPVVVVRGYAGPRQPDAGGRALLRPAAEDLFPRGRGAVADILAGPWPGGAWSAADRSAGNRSVGERRGADPVTPPRTAIRGGDLDRAVAAGERAGHGLVDVQSLDEPPRRLAVVPRDQHELVAAGVCAGVVVAALADLGYGAAHRRPLPSEPGVVVVAVDT